MYLNVISLRRRGSDERVEPVPSSQKIILQSGNFKKNLANLILYFHFQCIYFILFNTPTGATMQH